MTTLIDFDALDRVVPAQDPYDYFVADDLLTPPSVDALAASFPALPVSGLLPAGTLHLSPLLTQLADELRGPRMATIMSAKFGVALDGRATMLTVRSRCAAKDGRIHTDSTGKVVTLLLYLNPVWDQEGGRLRVLRSGTDLDDYAAEVPPLGGTMVAFRRSDHSWHGHRPFEGERRAIMVNWMRDRATAACEQARHRLAATLKGVFA